MQIVLSKDDSDTANILASMTLGISASGGLRIEFSQSGWDDFNGYAAAVNDTKRRSGRDELTTHLSGSVPLGEAASL